MESAHNHFMRLAIEEAMRAEQSGEVPVGAVLINGNEQIISRTHNCTIAASDPTAHAEILALREGGLKRSNYRLLDTTLYVTIEPCVMCMGALIHARVKRLVYGAADPKWGAVGSLFDFSNDDRFNHRLEVVKGIGENRCRQLMQQFFRKRRSSIYHFNLSNGAH